MPAVQSWTTGLIFVAMLLAEVKSNLVNATSIYDRIAIQNNLSLDEILVQLSEESSELAMAALKYRRSLDNGNPTPVSPLDAYANLMEEVSDVFNVLFVTGILQPDLPVQHYINSSKIARWRHRLDGLELAGGA